MHPSSSHLLSQRLLAAELLAFTVHHLFPQVILMGGGVNSLGFYYDFIFEQPLTDGMKELIDVHLHRLIKEGHPVRFISMMRENAEVFFEHHQQAFLAYRVSQQTVNIVDLVQIEDFYGICPSLSLTSTQEVGYAKLLSISTFIQNIQGQECKVTRLLGTSQEHSKDLKIFLKSYDSFLKRRDHRHLGVKLNLFSFSEKMGSLGVIWHPKGMQLRHLLQEWLRKQLSEMEQQVSTPSVLLREFVTPDPQELDSFLFEGEEYCLSSSMTRQHMEFFQNFPSDQAELPWKITEYATIYRHYPESQRWGLFCHCSYFTDQTTICCLKEQVVSELISSLHFIEQIITIFGFKAQWYLVAAREKTSRAKQEHEAVEWLRQAMNFPLRVYSFSSQLQDEENEQGPRLELRVQDGLGREWPLSSLSIVRPIRLSAQELDNSGLVVIARQIWGSLDRLIALLVEHDEGNFPLWLAPEQVRVIPIGEANHAYAKQIVNDLRQQGLRVKCDRGQAKLSERIHEAEKENVPYLILVGEQERVKQKISIRASKGSDQSQSVDLKTFLNKVYQESLCPIPDRKG